MTGIDHRLVYMNQTGSLLVHLEVAPIILLHFYSPFYTVLVRLNPPQLTWGQFGTGQFVSLLHGAGSSNWL